MFAEPICHALVRTKNGALTPR